MTGQPPTNTPSSRRPGRVAFVGAGPGDRSLLTIAAAALLREADAIVTDQHTPTDLLADLAREDVEVIETGHGEHGQPLTHASRAKLVVRAAKAHREGLVVRLMDGDPSVFNGLAEEAAALAKAGVEFDVVPGVSAVSAVPAYAGVPLSSSATSAVHVFSGARGVRHDFAGSVGDDVTVVVLGAPEHLVEAAATCRAASSSSSRSPARSLRIRRYCFSMSRRRASSPPSSARWRGRSAASGTSAASRSSSPSRS